MCPTSYQTAPPRDWKTEFNTRPRARSSEPCALQGIEETPARLVADQARRANLLARGVEEDRPGWAEQAESLEQLAVLGAVGGDVGLEQERPRELLLHRRVG